MAYIVPTEMHIDEDLKAEWCPLKEVKELEDGNGK